LGRGDERKGRREGRERWELRLEGQIGRKRRQSAGDLGETRG